MDIKRKDFIKTLSAGFIILSGIPLYINCSGIKRKDIADNIADNMENSLLKKLSKIEILKMASLAPSGHNMQPWFVKIINSGKWIVGIDEERLLPAVDPLRRETLLSIGAFIENLSIAANSFGFKTDIKIIAKSPLETDIVEIKLTKTEPIGNNLELIKKRRTVKHNFLNDELKKSDIKELTNLWENHIFYFSKNSEHAKCISEGALESFRDQTFRDDAQKELSGTIRFFLTVMQKKCVMVLLLKEWRLLELRDGLLEIF